MEAKKIKKQMDKQKQRVLFCSLALESSNTLGVLKYRNGIKFQVVDKTYMEQLKDMFHPLNLRGNINGNK